MKPQQARLVGTSIELTKNMENKMELTANKSGKGIALCLSILQLFSTLQAEAQPKMQQPSANLESVKVEASSDPRAKSKKDAPKLLLKTTSSEQNFSGSIDSSTPSINSVSGGDGSGGGAFVKKDGVWMSFYEAGLYVKTGETGNPNLPELEELKSLILSMDFVSASSKQKFLMNLIPSEKRKYYIAAPSMMTHEVYQRLIDVVSSKFNVDAGNLALAAVTDIPNKTTYLFTEFYSGENTISHSSLIANLFHETYWLVNPLATYEDVYRAEVAFQNWYERQTDHSARSNLSIVMATTVEEKTYSYIQKDLEEGNLNGLVKMDNSTVKRIPVIEMGQLFGGEFVRCVAQLGYADSTTRSIKICYSALSRHLMDLYKRFPKSEMIRLMLERSNALESDWRNRGSTYGDNDMGNIFIAAGSSYENSAVALRSNYNKNTESCLVNLTYIPGTNGVGCLGNIQSYQRPAETVYYYLKPDLSLSR